MTLHKMYLIPAAAYDARRLRLQPAPQPPPVKTKRATKRIWRTSSQHPHDKRVALRTKLLEADITEADLMHRFADFLRKVLAQPTPPKAGQRLPSIEQRPEIGTVELAETPLHTLVAQRPEPPSASTSYEVSKGRASSGSVVAETSDSDDAEQGVYEVSSPYLNSVRFLDEQYCIRRVSSTLMIGDVPITVHEKSDLSIGGTRFRGRRGIWELVTCKNVNSDVITNSDLNAYKSILVRTNAHLVGYEPGDNIQVSRGVKYAKVISKLFPRASRPRRSALRQYWASFRGSHA